MKRKAFNPFYSLLVVAGVLFVLTACAYLVMTVRAGDASGTKESTGLLAVVERHGLRMLIVELIVLAVATFGAIGTDDYWARRERQRAQEKEHESEPLRGS